MTSHSLKTQIDQDQSESDFSNSDSLIREFQEFETQVYSGTLFQLHGQSTRSRVASAQTTSSQMPVRIENLNVLTSSQRLSLRSQTNAKFEDHERCGTQGISKNQVEVSTASRKTAECQTNQPVQTADFIPEPHTGEVKDEDALTVEEDSLDEEDCSALAGSSQAQKPGNYHQYTTCAQSSNNNRSEDPLPSSMLRSTYNSLYDNRLLSHNNETKPSNATATSSNTVFHYSNETPVLQWFPSSVSHSLSNLRLIPQSTRASLPEQPPVFHERSFASTPLKRSESAQFTNKPNVSHDDNGEQLELVNPHPILPHAEEDPIETHDQVVAEMAAQGVVWAPPSMIESNLTNRSASQSANNRSTTNTRWYSAGIEEEQVITQSSEADGTRGSNQSNETERHLSRNRTTTPCTQQTTKTNASSQLSTQNPSHVATHNALLSAPDSPDVKCTSGKAAVENQMLSDELSTKQSVDVDHQELKARLDHEIALRKQQDDYIRQLQKYYDNLLTKHALAEVTIDQLRMGGKVCSESGDRANSNINTQRTSDLGCIDRSPLYQSQPITVLPTLKQGSMMLGTSNEKLLASGPQLRYASTPMLISASQQQGHLNGSRDWSTTQTTKPHLSEESSSYRPITENLPTSGVRKIDWTFGAGKYTSSEHLCKTVPEEGPSQYLKYDQVGNAISSDETQPQQRVPNSSLPSKSTKLHLSGKSISQESTRSQPHDSKFSPRDTIDSSGGSVPQAHDKYIPGNHWNDHSEQQSGAVDDRRHDSTPEEKDNDVALGPNEVYLNLMTSVIDLKAKLGHIKLRIADRDDSLVDFDIHQIREQYIQLNKCYRLARRRWPGNSCGSETLEFDPNHTLDKELFQLPLQLDDIEACLQLTDLHIDDSTNSRGNARLTDNDRAKFAADVTGMTEFSAKYPTVMDSGVLSSPSRSDREHDLSSVLSSPIAKNNLRAVEDLYVDLMDRYNRLKQCNASSLQVNRLYEIMKHLYDLAITANGHSSVIPTPEELESLFQLDGDTRKLSEELEKVIRTERELSAYSSHSNVSGRDQYPDRRPSNAGTTVHTSAENKSCLDPHPSTSKFTKNSCGLSKQNITTQMPLEPGSGGSSSAQDSGLSTPPISEPRSDRLRNVNHSRGAHPVPESSKSHRAPILESDSSPTAKSVPTYSTQGHPSDSGLPGSYPTNHTLWFNTNGPSTSKTPTGSHNVSRPCTDSPGCHVVPSRAEVSVDDATKKRMEAIEAGIRLLQQELKKVYDEKQNSPTVRNNPSLYEHSGRPPSFYSSDLRPDLPADSTSSAGHGRRVRKHKSATRRTNQRKTQQCSQLRPDDQFGSVGQIVSPNEPYVEHKVVEGYKGAQRPETDHHSLVAPDGLPMRFYGTAYDRWKNTDSSAALCTKKFDSHNLYAGQGRYKPRTSQSSRYARIPNRPPADVSSDDDHSEYPKGQSKFEGDSDQDTCSPHGSNSQGSETDCFDQEEGVSFHPSRGPIPRSILRRGTSKTNFPPCGHPLVSPNPASRRDIRPCPGFSFDRSVSVAYDLDQLPAHSAYTIPPDHLGGSMPVLINPNDYCELHTPTSTHGTRTNVCRECHYRPSESTKIQSELYPPPPPPKPAFLAEPHQVGPCAVCGGSGQALTPYTDHIRRPLMPKTTSANIYGRRVLSFAKSSRTGPLKACHHNVHDVQTKRPVLSAGLIHEGAYINPINQTCIREYTEVGGRCYAIRELACNTPSLGSTPYSLRMQPCSASFSGSCRNPKLFRRPEKSCQQPPPSDSSQSVSSGSCDTDVECTPAGVSTGIQANTTTPWCHCSNTSMINTRRSFPSARDSTLDQVLATAKSVRLLTRQLRKSLEDVCSETKFM